MLYLNCYLFYNKLIENHLFIFIFLLKILRIHNRRMKKFVLNFYFYSLFY